MTAPHSIRYLLPLELSEHALDRLRESDDDSDGASDDRSKSGASTMTVEVYQQAKPLVHPRSSAAIKTLGKMLDDPELMRRMLQRTVHNRTLEPSEASQKHEEMVLRFDPQARQSRDIRLARVKQLLAYYGLHVDDIAYRQWEQRLPEGAASVSVATLAHALRVWFSDKVLCERLAAVEQSATSKRVTLETSLHGGAGHRGGGPSNTRLLEKAHSAPFLHPFTLLTQHNDATQSFDYDQCAKSPPRLVKTLNETNSLKSKLIIHATHELRRKTKILSRLDSPSRRSLTQAPSTTLQHSASTSSLDSSPASLGLASAAAASNQTHERLHQEKLARDVLRRCSTHSLAPSNRERASKLIPQMRLQKAQQALAKQTRMQNVETAKAFSASIAMISRHIQNEELRDLRELHHEQQAELANERRQWSRVHKAHCRALAEDQKQQHMRDVHAMKAIAREELEIVRNYLNLRQDMLKCNKQPFSLSESTSTLFQSPPEILAAKATAKTPKQKKKLLAVEREHLDHVRSLQLLDYVYDKKRAVMEALKPKAEAALVEVEIDAAAAVDSDESALPSLGELLEQLRAQGQDVSAFLPPPNSPPAALKYFGTSRAVPLPPFASSADRHLS